MLSSKGYDFLEPEIPLPLPDLHELIPGKFPDSFLGDVLQLFPDTRLPNGLGIRGGVVLQVLLQSHEGVGQAAVLNLSGLRSEERRVGKECL